MQLLNDKAAPPSVQPLFSSESGDGLISVDWSVSSKLVVDTLPLEVVVLLNIDSSVQDWLPHVHEEEQRKQREGQSYPVAGETNVEDTISLVRHERGPPSLVAWGSCEGCSLLPKAWNFHVDANLQLGSYLVVLDHGNYLSLLFVSSREGGTYLGQVLVDVVLHFQLLYFLSRLWL